MWFKSIQPYRFDKPFEYTPESLAESLAKSLFTQCTAYAMSSMGWFPPLGDPDAPLVHAAGHYMIIALKVQDKILPASVVKEQLDERCHALLAQGSAAPKGKQKQRLKEEIYNALLPKALTKSTIIHGIIDTKGEWLWVNASSPSKAEMFLSSLREVLGSLPVIKPEVSAPSATMTSWLRRGYIPDDLVIEDMCVMIDPSVEGGTIRCRRQDLQSKNIQSFLRDGCEINQMALTWRDQVSFVLCHDFTFKSMRFLDAVKEVVDDIQAETPEQQFDADFVIMTETLHAMMGFVVGLFVDSGGMTTSTAGSATESEKSAQKAASEVHEAGAPSNGLAGHVELQDHN